jgi:integrase
VVIQCKQNGRAIRKAFVIRGTKAEARTFEARMRSELEAGDVVKPALVPRFSSFCVDEYKPSAKLHLKPATWTKRSSQLATLIEFFGECLLTDINDQLVDAYKRERRDAGLKNVSINNELRVLRKVLLFARDERGIALSPPRMRFLAEGDRRPKVWNAGEVKRLFDACAKSAPALLPILVFLVNTGARRGEALALRWEHVDLERRLVKIWPTEEDDDEGEAWEPKNRRPREVPIGDRLLPWLSGERASATWVFPSSNVGRFAYWPENTYQRVQRLASLSGGVHTLRHTYASHFLQAEPDLFLLAKILGHSHTRVTELYSHLLPNHLERGRNAVAFAPEVGPAIVKAKTRWRSAEVVANDGNAREPRKDVR